ncbi:MAG: CHAT domain-containing protein, partial [Cyanobacteria bacterium]|nr:CHAT domain-containing protein [Cyanobacteriota bacterium]MDW8203031.1 CHAT domain-containing protein [Cyanobacteriota bacterium SKYGB_h_bin112]
GSARPTLDIRAGVAPGAISTPLGLIGRFSPTGLTTGSIPTNAAITLNRIRFDASDGQVYLSTQYNPNLGLSGGDIVFTGTSPGLDLSSASGNGGAVILDSRGRITIPGEVSTFANGSASGGNVTLAAVGDVTVGNIDTSSIVATGDGTANHAGAITITSGGAVTTGSLAAASEVRAGNGTAGIGGTIALTATGSVQTQAIRTAAIVGGNGTAGNGGIISLTSKTGSIVTANLDTSSLVQTGTSGSGGNVSLISPISITTGTVTTNASTGSGGSVFIDPRGDVQVTFINAQGGTAGFGGTVDITTGSLFRATGTFTNRTGTLASISTTGGLGGGNITLRHGGGNQTPFIVGNLFTNNGTAGAITSGGSTIATTFLVPPGTFTRGNIRVITPGNSNRFNFSGDFFGGSGNDLKGEILLPPKTDTPNFDPVLDLRYRALEEAFTTEYAQYFGVEAPPSIKSIAQAVAALKRIAQEPGVPSALIYVYFVPTNVPATDVSSFDIQRRRNDDVLELLMITGNGAPVYKRYPRITRQMVTAVADDMRIATSDAENPDYREPAQQLYEWIIAPLEADLQNHQIQQLVFLTDLKLRSLPLAALYNGKQFLVERYAIGLMPSFSLTSTTYTNIQSAPVLGMGASTFQELNPLPAIPTELALITHDLRQGGQAFLNDQFTLDNLKAKRIIYPLPILHLATHAEFKPGNAGQSYIQLWDTKLRLDQIPQMGWNKPLVDLLVLSACRTALGDREAELGFGGIAFQSGVRSVLASLWYVSDIGTLSLMQEFYSQLQTTPTRAEALRQAQIAMARGNVTLKAGTLQTVRGQIPIPPELQALGDIDLSHPYYWSAFTMIGNPW